MRMKLLVWTVNTLVGLTFMYAFLFVFFHIDLDGQKEEDGEPVPFCATFPAIPRNMPDSVAVRLDTGKNLFKNNCASCHNKNMVDDMTGPALAGVKDRWKEYPAGDLYAWVRNSQGMYEKGHPRAVALIDEWQSVMNAFPNLTDQDIDDILIYVEAVVY
ncbi:MAG: cytochrome c [Bacteroidota bacterium]